MEKEAKIYVAGHLGMVGNAIVKELQRQGYANIITRTHKELDLTRQKPLRNFLPSKLRSMYSWRQPRWEVSLPITAEYACGREIPAVININIVINSIKISPALAKAFIAEAYTSTI